MKPKELKEALEDMIYQFGYRGVVNNKPVITTGGLSALESAFNALEWFDPHFIQEEGNTCEIVGCMEESSSGQNWGDMYLRLCYKHSAMLRNGEERPEVKDYAIERELKRDKTTGYLINKQ